MRIKKVLRLIIPPENWRMIVIVLLGIFSGLSIYAFHLSKASSYLSDNPKTCVNCHIMAPQYATWSHSSHQTVTNCNDCHVPHNNVFNKYFFKAKDGLRHASIFTLRAELQVIHIKEAGQKVVQMNCIRCHSYLLSIPQMSAFNADFDQQRYERRCWECHRETPHGTINSLSSVPNARIPLPESPVPEWLKKE
jgi:cytochrome c nitrite reductase small subunit